MKPHLSMLPASVLSIVTYHLELPDTVKLALLTGSTLLSRKLLHDEGVKTLSVCSKSSHKIAVHLLPCLPCFQRLTCIAIIANESLGPDIPGFGCWMPTLPPTMLEIRLGYRQQLDAFLRPVDASKDDELTRLVYSHGGCTPLDLTSHFPSLRMLRLQQNENHSDGWNSLLVRRFFARLPTSLTSLSLPLQLVQIDPTELILPPPAVIRNLSDLEMTGGRFQGLGLHALLVTLGGDSLRHLKDVASDEAQSKLDSASIHSLVAPLSSLESLTLQTRSPASMCYLGHLRQLKSLQLTILNGDAGYIVLPPLLTELTLRSTISSDQLTALLRATPRLLSFQLVAMPITDTLNFSYLPPMLTNLSIGTRLLRNHRLPCSLSSPLPPTLSRLRLPAGIENNIESLDLLSLTSLQQLELPAWMLFGSDDASSVVYSTRRSLSPLPPSLCSLTLVGASIWYGLLGMLPKSLSKLHCQVEITPRRKDPASPFSALRVWSPATLIECLRATYVPHLSQEAFVVTLSCMATEWPHPLTEIVEYRPGTGPHLGAAHRVALSMPRLTHFVSSYASEAIPVENLPTSLIEWRTPRIQIDLPSISSPGLTPSLSCNTWSTRDSGALLPNLRILELDWPHIVFDEDHEGRPAIWPLLATAPLLERLQLHDLDLTQLNALQYLPSTILFLQLSVTAALTAREVAATMDGLFAHPTWLPNLIHLQTNHVFPLRCLLPHRIHRLRTLQLERMLVTSDIFDWPFDSGNSDASIDSQVIRRHCLLHLLPTHLRRHIGSVLIDWSAELLQKLASDSRIKSLTLETWNTEPTIHGTVLPTLNAPTNQTASDSLLLDDLGGLLPCTLTNLDMSAFPSLITTFRCSSFPRNLSTLQVLLTGAPGAHYRAVVQNFVAAMPPTLTDLGLLVDDYLQCNQVAALPRGLLRLSLSGMGSGIENDAYGELPSSLQCLHLADLPPSLCALLPPSLLVLEVYNYPNLSHLPPNLPNLLRYNDTIFTSVLDSNVATTT